MTPNGIYLDFIRCEDRFADLYLDLSIRFCDQMALSWFWVDMAMSKKQSAGLVHYCLANEIFAQDLPDPAVLQALGQQMEALCERAADPAVSLDHAFDIAIQAESSKIGDIRNSLIMPIEAPMPAFQKKLDLFGVNHFRKLKSAADEFAVSPGVASRLQSFI